METQLDMTWNWGRVVVFRVCTFCKLGAPLSPHNKENSA